MDTCGFCSWLVSLKLELFFYIPLKSFKHITDYITYMIQYPTTKTILLGAKNYVYLNGN